MNSKKHHPRRRSFKFTPSSTAVAALAVSAALAVTAALATMAAKLNVTKNVLFAPVEARDTKTRDFNSRIKTVRMCPIVRWYLLVYFLPLLLLMFNGRVSNVLTDCFFSRCSASKALLTLEGWGRLQIDTVLSPISTISILNQILWHHIKPKMQLNNPKTQQKSCA